MELNSLLFPAPKMQYTAEELEGEIMYIPRHYRFNMTHRSIMKTFKQLQREKYGVEPEMNIKEVDVHLEDEEEMKEAPPTSLIKKNPTVNLNSDDMNSDSLSEIRDEEAIIEHLQEPRFGKRNRGGTDQASPKMS